MKKTLCLFVSIITSLSILVGCGNYNSNISTLGTEKPIAEIHKTTDRKPTTYGTVNNLEGVSMIIKEGTASPEKLTVVFENTSDKECLYGEYFLLEKKIDGIWYQVPVAMDGNYGFHSIGYNLAPEEKRDFEVDWEWLYGSLDNGEYRIIKDILDFRSTGDYDTYYLAAEFIIQ